MREGEKPHWTGWMRLTAMRIISYSFVKAITKSIKTS